MITLIKKIPASKDTEIQKQSSKIVDVLGRIYGRNHLLSLERYDIIHYMKANVKHFFLIFQDFFAEYQISRGGK